MTRSQNNAVKRFTALAAGLVVLSFGIFGFGCGSSTGPENASNATPIPQTTVADQVVDANKVLTENIDYSRFGHSTEAHAQLPCLLCHVREENTTRLSFPGKSGHLPCAGCHVEQFSSPAPNPSSAMCAICHTDAQTGEMKNFPPLRSFRAVFNHGKHVSQASCTTCHSPSRAGVAFAMPAGASAHATCFQCHKQDEPIGSCSTCHTQGTPVRKSDWAKAYGSGFSHREHMGKRGISCNSCHTVRAGSGRTGQVSSPVLAMHFPAGRAVSCATCHNDKRAFGAEEFTNCKRCHEGQNFSQ